MLRVLQDLVTPRRYPRGHVGEVLEDDQIIAIPGNYLHLLREIGHGETETTIGGTEDLHLADGRHQGIFAIVGIIRVTLILPEPEEDLGMAHLRRAQHILMRPRSTPLHSVGAGLDEVAAGAIMNIADEEEAGIPMKEMDFDLVADREDRHDVRRNF